MALTKKQRTKTVLAVRFKNPTEIRLIKKSAKKLKVSVNAFCRGAIVGSIVLDERA
jgi:hypothetical protein